MKLYVHHVPGRLRIRAAVIKNQAAWAETLAQEFTEKPGITHCEVNRHAGSITINYDTSRMSSRAVLLLCHQKGLLPEEAQERSPISNAIVNKAGKLLGQAVFNVFVKQTVERSVLTMMTTVLK